jgi:hypothetical protein
MPSVFELVSQNSSDINDLAREYDIEGRGSMNKAEKIIALSDETISDKAKKILVLNKTRDDGRGLVSLAEEAGIETDLKKKELQTRLLRRLQEKGEIGGGRGPYPSNVGDKGAPHDDLESHFDSAEDRKASIQKRSIHVVGRAFQDWTSFMVVESLRPKDKQEPLRAMPSHMSRHPDSVVVFEARVSRLLPISSEMIRETAKEATRRAFDNYVSRVVFLNLSDVENPKISYSHREHDGRPVFEAFVPRGPYPLESAELSPVFRAAEK